MPTGVSTETSNEITPCMSTKGSLFCSALLLANSKISKVPHASGGGKKQFPAPSLVGIGVGANVGGPSVGTAVGLSEGESVETTIGVGVGGSLGASVGIGVSESVGDDEET